MFQVIPVVSHTESDVAIMDIWQLPDWLALLSEKGKKVKSDMETRIIINR